MRTVCLPIVAIVVTAAYGQPPDTFWTRTYGGTDGDYGRSVEQTTDGGYIVTGYTSSFGAGGDDMYLLRTDANGDTLWTRTYGGTQDDYGWTIQKTTDYGYIVMGYTWSFGAGGSDIILLKTDANGDTLWTRTYGGTGDDNCHSVQQTTDSGYIIAGTTWSFGAGGSDVYLIKTDANGDTLWTRLFGGTANDYGHSVEQTTDGGYIVSGATSSFGAGGSDVYLIKTDVNGDTLWTMIYGGTGDEYSCSVQQTPDNGYIITGVTWSFGAGGSDVYLIKTDANGDTLWTRMYGGTNDDFGWALIQTIDNGYIIAGETWSFGAGSCDVYLLKIDANGDTLWTVTYGGTDADRGWSVQQTTDGGYIIVGETWSFGTGDGDVWLIKTDPDVGIEAQSEVSRIDNQENLAAIIFRGPLQLPAGRKYKVFDIMGRVVEPSVIKPGIYFIEIDGIIIQKVVKVR